MVQEAELKLIEIYRQKQEEFNLLLLATLSISSDNQRGNFERSEFVAIFPDSLRRSFKKWKNDFKDLVNPEARYEFEIIPEDEDTPHSCPESAKNLKKEFNTWLSSEDGWQKIRQYLEKNLDSEEAEIWITIQTDNQLLRQLPWQEWQIFTDLYPQAEIALSAPDFEPPVGRLKRQRQVRILVVLGGDNNINLEQDRALLDRVKAHAADIKILEQPRAEDLRDELREGRGWHIFFFAGHSESREDGTIGSIVLNNEGDHLTINEFKQELSTAIEKGLQLAIFNSCDGLGLANQLAKLHLPSSIVMREVISDEIACDFLTYFLDEFSRNASLFATVHQVRKELEKKWNLPEQYPGAHWLPVIVHNPGAPNLPTWKSLISEYQLPLKYRLPILVVVILGVISLSVSIHLEFKEFEFYAQLYPHIILFPWFAFWIAVWGIYQALCQFIKKKKLWRPVAVVLFISIVALYIEVTSDNMMLFELSENAVATVAESYLEIKNEIENIPAIIIDKRQFIQSDNIVIKKTELNKAVKNFIKFKEKNQEISMEAEKSYHQFMKYSLSYQVWKGNNNCFSLSRWFYGFIFWLIVFTVLMLFVLWPNLDSRQVINQLKYLSYLVATEVTFLFWIPLRLYYTQKTKYLIFGSTSTIEGLDFFIYIIIFFLLTMTLIKISQLAQKYTLAIIITVVLAISIYIGIFQTDLIDRFVGLNTGDTRIWFLFPLLNILWLYIFLSNEPDR
ncbi:MAG: CHAT domain-containing protein [Symploca sp. SIO3E6]|nr:CHAT domain-containing protein [Caldora sp. SIO3E6]